MFEDAMGRDVVQHSSFEAELQSLKMPKDIANDHEYVRGFLAFAVPTSLSLWLITLL